MLVSIGELCVKTNRPYPAWSHEELFNSQRSRKIIHMSKNQNGVPEQTLIKWKLVANLSINTDVSNDNSLCVSLSLT